MEFECKRRILIGIKYSTHDLICDVINHLAGSCDLSKVSVCDKIVIEKLEKRNDGNRRKFFT